ncbi:protein of unknown function [Ruminococcus sp. YRD2003]|uniref:DUF4367 domain-containing protein n=1 Tax=Ruminococcus sp. YRD2003 TaxID=1452313 RepID=UPI0008C23EA2|nr:protein of unknown function [Ruminococcus flavefaciens]
MDDKLKTAIQEVVESETDSFLAQLDEAPHEFRRSYEDSARRLIRRRKKSYYPLISSVGRRVITVIAAASVMCGSVLTAASIRDTTYEIKREGTEYGYRLTVDNDVAKHYPETIENEYCLTDIPDGYEKTIYQKGDKKIRTVYQGKSNEYIIFYQYTKSAFYSDFFYETQEVMTDENDRQYICYTTSHMKDNTHTFFWDNDEYIFEVSSKLDKQALFEVCKSVRIKDQ